MSEVTDVDRLSAELARTRIELTTAKTERDHWKRIAYQKTEQLEQLQATRKTKGATT